MTSTEQQQRLRARLNAVIAEIIPDTMTVLPCIPTGGGCEAMSIEDKGRTLLITDGDACLPFDDDGYRTVVFDYGVPGDPLTIEWLDGDEERYWSNVRTSLQAWVDGDPYFDMKGF